MMPQGSPTNFGNLARGVQAYAYALARGGDEAQAQRAALVHVTVAELGRVTDMANASAEASRVLNLADVSNEGWFNLQRAQAAIPGADTETYTTAVKIQRPDGTTFWKTVQSSVPRGLSYSEILDRIGDDAATMAGGGEFSYGGSVAEIAVQTTIGHTPGYG